MLSTSTESGARLVMLIICENMVDILSRFVICCLFVPYFPLDCKELFKNICEHNVMKCRIFR